MTGSLSMLLRKYSANTLAFSKAPCFFTAGCYVVLGRLIPILGPKSSPLSHKRYLLIFSTCDLLSIIIQAIGGGYASAQDKKVNGDTKPGTNIMIGGILFQMASITVFGALFSYILFRTRNVRLSKGLRLTIAATAFAVVLIYIRSVYRTMELLQGWKGFLITHEQYFVAFDGSMMAAAVIVFNIINPAWLLVPPEPTDTEDGLYEYKIELTKDQLV